MMPFSRSRRLTSDGATGGGDPGLAPPPLEGEGAKVQEIWLYHFVKEPTTIRPWLTYRMPTFGFRHGELQTLIKYFSNLAHQEIFFGEIKTNYGRLGRLPESR
jgi:hypothetical protein